MYDASLDEFKAHNWKFNPVTSKTNYYSYNVSKANTSFKNTRFNIQNNQRKYFGLPSIANENYKWFGFRFARNRNFMMKRMSGISEKGKTDEIEMADGLEVEELEEIAFMKIEDNTKEKISLKKIQIRKNFKETAFFRFSYFFSMCWYFFLFNFLNIFCNARGLNKMEITIISAYK